MTLSGKPKRQKKYLSREQILKDITASQRKFIRLRKQAEEQDDLADLLTGGGTAKAVIQDHRDYAQKLRDKASRIESTRLPKLKNALSAFDTAPLGLDGAIQRQVTLEPL